MSSKLAKLKLRPLAASGPRAPRGGPKKCCRGGETRAIWPMLYRLLWAWGGATACGYGPSVGDANTFKRRWPLGRLCAPLSFRVTVSDWLPSNPTVSTCYELFLCRCGFSHSPFALCVVFASVARHPGHSLASKILGWWRLCYGNGSAAAIQAGQSG